MQYALCSDAQTCKDSILYESIQCGLKNWIDSTHENDSIQFMIQMAFE